MVDDHPDTVELLGAHIERLGHACRTARCGADALAIAVDFVPEIAILDLGLPDISGFDLAHALRRRGDIYLVAFTGYAEPAIRARAADAGFARFVLKPIPLDELRAIIASAPG